MRLFITLLLIILGLNANIYGNGVGVVDANQGVYFQLLESHVSVSVNNQIATTKATHVFKNTTGQPTDFSYAFPLAENASTTNIRWFNNGVWSTAPLIAAPQDSTLPGVSDTTTMDPNLAAYLGQTPVYFKVIDIVPVDGIVTVELTYVELLPYNNNEVQYTHPNNYALIQVGALDSLSFMFQVQSARDIVNIDLPSHNGAIPINLTSDATLIWSSTAPLLPTTDYFLTYELDPDQLGLFSFSTYIPFAYTDCDTGSTGYFAMIVEPDGSDSAQVIDKVFTLILDVSGSMGGSKIAQARDAATFIVNNMNFNDKFNIVEFSSSASSWQSQHVDVNAANVNAALNYISGLNSGGGTSFTSAFNIAIPQFTYDTTVANIIIFLTDGRANESDTEVLNTLDNLITTNNLTDNLQIHTFGIGTNVNQSLLSIIATENNGLASFVGANDLFTTISSFYSKIQNPVLLDVQAAFYPNLVYDVYPVNLPNLYKGQQMILTGRYAQPDSMQVTFSGQSFGNPTSFQYDINLVDTLAPERMFLTKIWAKMKIDHLMTQYYNAGTDTAITNVLKDSVTTISICYGVVSPFTSFTGIPVSNSGGGNNTIFSNNNGSGGFNNNNPTTRDLDSFISEGTAQAKKTAHVFPNPFTNQTTLRFSVSGLKTKAVLKIYDGRGILVRVIEHPILLQGVQDIIWDGRWHDGVEVWSGTYFYTIEIDDEPIYLGKIIKVD